MAYQTSCASYTSGRVGLSSATAVVADAAGLPIFIGAVTDIQK
jgi:hypothetical protein